MGPAGAKHAAGPVHAGAPDCAGSDDQIPKKSAVASVRVMAASPFRKHGAART